jgi:hypothetical protein
VRERIHAGSGEIATSAEILRDLGVEVEPAHLFAPVGLGGAVIDDRDLEARLDGELAERPGVVARAEDHSLARPPDAALRARRCLGPTLHRW